MSKSEAKFLIMVGLIVFVPIIILTSNTLQEDSAETKKDKSRLLEYLTEKKMDEYSYEYKKVWLSSYPPLKPERFRRRMKMLFAIDINDYPENAWIRITSDNHTIEDVYFKGEYISIEGQKFYSLKKKVEITDDVSESRSPLLGMEDYMGEDYGTIILNYLLYNDLAALDSITTYKYRLIKESLGDAWEKDEMAGNLLFTYNILYKVYSLVHTTKPELIYNLDKNKDVTDDSKYIRTDYEISNFYRASALRSDLQLLYILNEKKKNRDVKCNSYDSLEDLSVEADFQKVRWFYYSKDHLPWHPNTPTRSITEYMSFLVQLHQKEFNKFVIQYMSGQNEISSDRKFSDTIRNQIRSNNYYGHAILREFCENPEREMPTLEKVGTSFNAAVVDPNTLLYLEPYPNSYDIDKIQPSEIFKAYEMGYDDYYFVEVTKPVESPVAGPDGYAMILDRTETVYGYIRKSDIQEITESEKVKKQIENATRQK